MKFLKKLVLTFTLAPLALAAIAQNLVVTSPDKQLQVRVNTGNSNATYEVTYRGKTYIENSPLGLITNEGDFSKNITLLTSEQAVVKKQYTQEKIKKLNVNYQANKLVCTFENAAKQKINVVFQVSNNDIAFRYELPAWEPRFACVVEKETTGFHFPAKTTTFLSPMMGAMTGYARTAPSYESGYVADAAMTGKNFRKDGFVFPALFHVGQTGWVLLSETGVTSQYCASHLGDINDAGNYTIDYPALAQNNGFGSTGASLSLPGVTPWRTITVGETLKPIVETTIPFDVVDPLYQASQVYKYGRATWSWIIWQDASMNYDDQVKFIDLASALKFEYILMDAFWDKNIGKDRMVELVKYAKSKNVGVLLWYNSNGAANDAPQSPRNKMNSAIERKKEMQWLRSAGIKGLKVDFLGGDKQETMKLYEEILSDANDYGLMIDFHGATLPRGWERMYPNYIGSEAVVASEMLVFSQGVRDAEAFNATMHPFIRNTVGSMEFGGVLLNKYLVKSNKDRNKRLTTDGFQLATAVLFQNPVQMFGLTPNNLTDVPAFEIDFMKTVPTTWDETVFVDGYPGKYSVIARRNGKQWFIAGVNALKQPLKLKLKLPMLANGVAQLYNDDAQNTTTQKELKINRNAEIAVEVQSNGGFIIKQ